MEGKKNEIILFENQGVKLEVNLKDETVWLNREQLAKLFDRDIKTIGKHINNALKEELQDVPTVAKFATVQMVSIILPLCLIAQNFDNTNQR